VIYYRHMDTNETAIEDDRLKWQALATCYRLARERARISQQHENEKGLSSESTTPAATD
jgi:hypothetical protein